MHTPGHTPESLVLAAADLRRSGEPWFVLTGDTLFVGDVGRPDLLASAGAGRSDLSADTLARRLYHSLHGKLLALPDQTRVFPAHGAGSSCGKQLSTDTHSTIGEQRRSNYALQLMDEDTFVAVVTEGQPLRPPYFAFDAEANRQLHPLLDESPPRLLAIDEVLASRENGAVLIDPRHPADFASGHLRRAVNVPLQGRFAEWAGDVLSPERDLALVGDPASALEAKIRLGRVGYDRVIGQLDDPAEILAARPELHQASSRLTVDQLDQLLDLQPAIQLIDVRSPGETTGCTIDGAREIPLPALTASLDDLDRDTPIVVYCASGTRSQIAASVLGEAGFPDVSDLLGGFTAWNTARPPPTKGDRVPR
jgi:rhodanese-related sulfurtransferase